MSPGCLRLAVRRSGATKSDIVNHALVRYLDPPPEKDPDREVLQRLDGLAKGIRRIHRDVEIATETLALHIRQFLMITPPVPKSEQQEAMNRGRERYEVFVEQIAKRIASDNGMVADIMERIAETHGDRFRTESNDGMPPNGSQPRGPLHMAKCDRLHGGDTGVVSVLARTPHLCAGAMAGLGSALWINVVGTIRWAGRSMGRIDPRERPCHRGRCHPRDARDYRRDACSPPTGGLTLRAARHGPRSTQRVRSACQRAA